MTTYNLALVEQLTIHRVLIDEQDKIVVDLPIVELLSQQSILR